MTLSLNRTGSRAWGCILLLLSLAAVLTSCSKGKDKGFLEEILSLEARAAKGAPASSIEDLKSAIERYGAEVQTTAAAMEKAAGYWRLLAFKYLEKGLYGDAYDTALVALRHYPDNSGLYYVAGVSAAYLSKTASAEKGGGKEARLAWLAASENAYKRSLEINPRSSRSLYGLAVLYTFELDRHEAALAPIETLLSIESKNVDALFVYARALYGTGRLEDAAAAYDKIISTTVVDEKKQMALENKKRILEELYGK